MNETVKLICIECPRGCELTVIKESGAAKSVEGNFCPKGKTYGLQEVSSPTRVVTSTVRVSGGGLISVKTDGAVPKGKIFEVMKCINLGEAARNVKIGDVIVLNVADTGINVIATRNAAD